MSAGLHIQLLGEFALTYDGARVSAVNSPRLRILLAYLILHRSAPQPRQHLAFLLWPDSDEDQARTNLRNLVHLLRHALPHSDCCLRCEGQVLLWDPHVSYQLDVTEFESALRSGAPQRAIELYRGDLLPDCYSDWIIPERERLRRLYLGALQQVVQEQEAVQNYPIALGYAQRLMQEEPLSEAHCRSLIRLQMLTGDRAMALRTYHTCATALRRELGVDPAQSTQELHTQILEGIEMSAAPAPPPEPHEAHLPHIGRQPEWSGLLAAWGSAARGRAQFVLITGDVGIGKTRLAEELLVWTEQQGFLTARATCHAAEGPLPYSPVIAWLRRRPLPRLAEAWQNELARLLPDVAGQHVPPSASHSDAPWERHRLFEALVRTIEGWSRPPAPATPRGHADTPAVAPRRPLLLFIDNLQWCDPDTLDWLHFLLRYDACAPLLIVGAMCSGEAADAHHLAGLLATLRREDLLTEIELAPLSRKATLALASHAASRPLDPAHAEKLYQASEGNPLFTVEMIQAGYGSPAVPGQESDELIPDPELLLPARVRQVLQAQLNRLSPAALDVTELVATAGCTCHHDILACACSLDEASLVRAIDELLRRRILRDTGNDCYEFTHSALRAVCDAGMSTAHRRLAQQRVAAAGAAIRNLN